mgnify:CR=1 FL=1
MKINPLFSLFLLLVLVSAYPSWAQEKPVPKASEAQEIEVLGVTLDPASRTPLVLLRGKQDKRELTMGIGPFEAQAIAIPLQKAKLPRPLTHDLIVHLLAKLKATLKKVVIVDLRQNTYYALLYMDFQGTELTADSRPSDAIALALRVGAPILVEEKVFEKAQGLITR